MNHCGYASLHAIREHGPTRDRYVGKNDTATKFTSRIETTNCETLFDCLHGSTTGWGVGIWRQDHGYDGRSVANCDERSTVCQGKLELMVTK